MLLVPASLYVFSWVHRVAPAVVAADLMRAFSITAAALGNLAAIYPYVFAAMALVAGGLTDTLGPRWTLALGGATMGLGAAVFGGASTFGVAFAGRLLVGLGASVMLIAWLCGASPGSCGPRARGRRSSPRAGSTRPSSPSSVSGACRT